MAKVVVVVVGVVVSMMLRTTSGSKVQGFRQALQHKVILAPLTRGGNLPFRRLCVEEGAEMTVSEMAYARVLTKGRAGKEKALLKKAENEKGGDFRFGVQIATNAIAEGLGAARIAQDAGADWIDLNCGCPIWEVTHRGLGSALLRKPSKLARLVQGIAEGSELPLTVKIRSGLSEDKINAVEVAAAVASAGAAAVTVHGRTQLQRYSRAADWNLLEQVAADPTVVAAGCPVIGNGDILAHWEATQRLEIPGIAAVMVGRGALIKPWIFREIAEGKTWRPTPEERIEVYWRLATFMKEHFGADEMGRKKAFYFLPWHFSFFCRWRPLREELFAEYPGALLQDSRYVDEVLAGAETSLPLLERLLRLTCEDAHNEISGALWDAETVEDAISALGDMAISKMELWEGISSEPVVEDDRGDRESSSKRGEALQNPVMG